MTPDPWFDLRRHTAARIALGRAGSSLPTAEWLRLGVAHALARDAVHAALDVGALTASLAALGHDAACIESVAPDRATYLRRPDLGRRLSPRSAALLRALPPDRPPRPPAGQGGGEGAATASAPGLCIVVADGLSATAAQQHAAPLLRQLAPRLAQHGQRIGRVLVALQARVALGDEAAAVLGAPAVLVLLGERPGLSSPDSLGAYLTWAPRPGRSDAERNCVSNIRQEGLSCAEAAHRIAWLVGAARRLGCTGVALKDESGVAGLAVE